MNTVAINKNIEDLIKGLAITTNGQLQNCEQYVDVGTVEAELLEQRAQPENVNDKQTKAKRRRRRNRPRKKKNAEKEDEQIEKALQDVKIDFMIKAVMSHKNGNLYRKRNYSCQRVNANLYANVNVPHTFETDHKKITNVSVTIDGTLNVNQTENGIINNVAFRRTIIKESDLQSAGTSAQKKTRKRKKAKPVTDANAHVQNDVFKEYLKREEVERGLKTGELIKGIIRINPKNYKNAYVPHSNRQNQDYIIPSIVDRNRAFEGDAVVIRVKPKEEWIDDQQSAEVVYIFEEVHPRTTVGTLTAIFNGGKKIALIHPRDARIPRITVPATCLPQNFFKDPKRYENVLYKAKIVEWRTPKFATGTIEVLGDRGKLKDETFAILYEHELDVEPFPTSIRRYLPNDLSIPPAEFAYREDLRGECVFTIDPPTARDLDDAVSCRMLPDGNVEVGVHIADVAHYLTPDTELDRIVARKGTTVYMVDRVFHMLPEEMCLKLSLLPGKDSLAFSVFWEMTPDGEVLSHRFSRTVINSCCQLAYDHAQAVIEGAPIVAADLPCIYNRFKLDDLTERVLKLQRIATNLRRKRFEAGALRIDQVKIVFATDPSGEPSDFYVYENTEAHRLIEEFMLLANVHVARRISDDFPDLAFLRLHEPPNPRLVDEVRKAMEVVGIRLDTSSSGALQRSVQVYSADGHHGATRGAVLNHLLAKPMTRARYFCAALEDCYEHYALSTPIYTHFTSPIRRYADVMVHRLLSASLGYTEKPNWSVDFVQGIAANCNKQKYNAKKAGEAHSDLFLVHYVERNQPFVKEAVVVDVREKFFDVLVISTGSVVRIYLNNLGDNVAYSAEKIGNDERKLWRLQITCKGVGGRQHLQTIEIFRMVRVALKRKGNTNMLEGTLVLAA